MQISLMSHLDDLIQGNRNEQLCDILSVRIQIVDSRGRYTCNDQKLKFSGGVPGMKRFLMIILGVKSDG